MRTVTSLLAICIIITAGTVAAQGTITAGAANFVRNAGCFDGDPSANLTGVSATLSQDHVFEFGWWYRVSGDTQERFFPVPTTQSYVNPTSTNSWTNVGGLGLFDAQEVITVTDTAGPSGFIDGTMTITNTSGADLSIDIYVMIDFDLQPTAGDDTATAGSSTGHIVIDDAGSNTAEFLGVNANAYYVATFGATDTAAILSDADIDNFANTGLPFAAGDFTGGFQWTTVTIPAAGSQAFRVSASVNTAAVPVELMGFSIE